MAKSREKRKTKTAHRGRILLVKGPIPDVGKPCGDENRRVYLCSFEGGARAFDLYASHVSLSRVRELVAWALAIGLPVECEPPGVLQSEYEWPLPGWKPERITKLPKL